MRGQCWWHSAFLGLRTGSSTIQGRQRIGRDFKDSLFGNAGDKGSFSGLGRSPGGGHDNPLQYSRLENPMDRGAWWATVSENRKESDMTELLIHTYTEVIYNVVLVSGV